MNGWLPVLVVLSSAIPGAVIFLLEHHPRARAALNLAGALLKVLLIGLMLRLVAEGNQLEARYELIAGFDFVLRADALGLLFVTLSGVLWLVTTVYAIGYLGDRHQARFFGFFSLCVSASTGIALAGTPLTFLLFYESLTLSTYPLVVHEGTPEALAAGRKYLVYTLAGGALLLLAVWWVHALAGPFEFTQKGVLRALGEHPQVPWLFAVFMVALGVKTALVPLHGWLPSAMVAPAPVSALLHAVAVVKAGAFGIIRVVYEVFGIEYSAQRDLLLPLGIVAAFTIVYGSIQALAQDDLKKRLAYSTISQLSYIVIGVALVSPLATLAALVHVVHQGIMKITMFFCAGILDHELGVHEVSELGGSGRRLPLTMAAFTVAALAMIGLPPMAGFITKWYLAIGSVDAGASWVMVILLVSTALNAAYFLPIVQAAWFRQRHEPWPKETPPSGRLETNPWLLWPPLFTAALTIVVGLFAATAYSVQAWAEVIVLREYLP